MTKCDLALGTDCDTFHREFRRLENRLTKEKRVSADGLNKAYEKSIHPELQDKILFYLSDEKTPCIKGETFVVKYVREGEEHILEGFDHQYKMSGPRQLLELFQPHPFQYHL